MKMHYALLVGLCITQLHAADESQPITTLNLNEVSVELLKYHLEKAGECSKIWYEALGKTKYPSYEPIKDAHTEFIKSHANDTILPIMLVALLNEKVIGIGVLLATCYSQLGEMQWADEHPECTPWIGGHIGQAYQKQDVGAKIVSKLLEHALKLGYEKTYLFSEGKINQKLYEGNGAVKLIDVIHKDKDRGDVPGIVYEVAHASWHSTD